MSVDTIAYIPNLKLQSLKAFLDLLYGTFHVTEYHDTGPLGYGHIGVKQLNRGVNYSETIIDSSADPESPSYIKRGLPDKTSGLYLALGADEEALAFMYLVCFKFGGFVAKDDSRGSFTIVDKNNHKLIELVMNDLDLSKIMIS
jgi:hypothetical protein